MSIQVLARFNSQPPEGGWYLSLVGLSSTIAFQLTAARRRLGNQPVVKCYYTAVSTHSRPKAAGAERGGKAKTIGVSTHSRPKAAGPREREREREAVSTHSRPKAAGCTQVPTSGRILCFNSQPPEGGWVQMQTVNRSTSCFNSQPPEGGWSQA